jgi:monoamine oxidase
MNKSTSVIIIGGGAAGLMAAYTLAGKFNVTIIEASEKLGGRIRSLTVAHAPGIVEAGAEFVHGNPAITLELLKKAGIEPIRVAGNMYRKENGQWVERNDFIEGWDELFEKMKQLKEDRTLASFMQEYFSDDKYAALRKQVTGYAEGFDVADVNKVSVKALYEEWSEMDEDNYRVPGGYCKLIDYLEQECINKGCRIITGETVQQVDWEENEVTVYTNKQQYTSSKLIVTIPLGVLQKSLQTHSINFTPAIDEQVRAATDIGFGSVVKVVLHFRERLWKADTGFLFSDEMVPVWWTQFPDTAPLLTGWIGGSKATLLQDMREEEILEKAILSLASIFSQTAEQIRDNITASYIFNWVQIPESLGAYSYPTPETIAARKILQQPLLHTIYFAGEGIYEGEHPGTVEAALASGLDVSRSIE